MSKKIPIIAIFGVLLLAGCASQRGWTPAVDPYGDTRAEFILQDKAECRELALQASQGGGAARGAGGAVGGAALGATAGALLGALSGAPGKGAATGAAIGGIGGAVLQGPEAEDQYKRVFTNCMRNRGHRVLN